MWQDTSVREPGHEHAAPGGDASSEAEPGEPIHCALPLETAWLAVSQHVQLARAFGNLAWQALAPMDVV